MKKNNDKKEYSTATNGNKLFSAARRNDYAKVIKLLRAGADANVMNEFGETPLHTACVCGYFNVAEALIIAGADVNARNCINSTPLHEACEWGHLGIAQILIEAKADINAKDIYKWMPVDYATAMWHLNIRWTLIEAGADAAKFGSPIR